MILNNVIIGTDSCGNSLKCGDICSFKIKLQRRKISENEPNLENNIETMLGMIIYDEDYFAFAFETLDNYAPVLLMERAELYSIKRIYEANYSNFNSMKQGDEWRDIYNNNLIIK